MGKLQISKLVRIVWETLFSDIDLETHFGEDFTAFKTTFSHYFS